VYLQRSRGYERRPSWSAERLKAVIQDAHRAGARVMVDNCYGEFTETSEPGHWGADVLAGSLLKNPGGGLAPTGGYIAGRRHLVERIGDHIYGPGMGTDMGPSLPVLDRVWQGLFYAPHAVAEALIGTAWAAALFVEAGLTVDPAPETWPRQDIIVAVEMPGKDALLAAVRAVQAVSPLDSFVTPEPWAMPGYPDPVVMAAGGFVPGGSLELSCDAPMRPPWRLYLQGGVMRQHTLLAAERILDAIGATGPRR
jgi:cystathionine beta-lyase family protein involved in aluminum resistance